VEETGRCSSPERAGSFSLYATLVDKNKIRFSEPPDAPEDHVEHDAVRCHG
jgi:hypothetical protein